MIKESYNMKCDKMLLFFFAVQSPITLERYKGKSLKSKVKMLLWQEHVIFYEIMMTSALY